MKTVITLLLISLSLTSFAGEKGNGGDAVVCRDAEGNIISAELLDYYEGRTLRNLKPLNHSSIPDEKFFHLIFERLKQFDPDTFNHTEEYADRFNQALFKYRATGETTERILFTHDPLIDIPDSGEVVLKKGCTVEQLAIRLKRLFPEDPEFIIQADILAKLSDQDVRGLALHEYIYLNFISRNRKVLDSSAARYLNQQIISRPLGSVDFSHYISSLVALYVSDEDETPGQIKVGTKCFVLPDLLIGFPVSQGFTSLWTCDKEMALVIDPEGKISREKSLQRGFIKYNLFVKRYHSNFLHGRLEVANDQFDFSFAIKDGGFGYAHFLFREVKLTMHFESHPAEAIYLNEFGFCGTPCTKEKKIAIAMVPPEFATSVTRKFQLDLDENFDLLIKQLD